MASTSSNILRDLAWSTEHKDLSSIRKMINSGSHSLKSKITSSLRSCVRIVSKPWSKAKPIGDELNLPPEPRNRFIEAVKRIEFNHAYRPTICPEAPYGYFRNRPIIGENTQIHGGIYVGVFPHEALVIDQKYGLLEKTLATLIARCAQIDETSPTYEYDVFSKAIALTRETLRYSEEGVQLIQASYNIQADDKVTLDLYLKKKVGIARHQVLLAGFLLERLREKGMIRGTPAIESQVSDEIPQERLLFTSSDGEIFRFDPTKGLGRTAIH